MPVLTCVVHEVDGSATPHKCEMKLAFMLQLLLLRRPLCVLLVSRLSICPRRQITTLDTHDGM